MQKRITNKESLPFWFVCIGALIVFTLPALVKDGMFMDAMLYTSVSHNLSEGIGTFWFPQFSYVNMSGLTSFHEQPPLGFGIQAVFFKLLGDGMYTERIYTFLMLCLAAWLIAALWKEVYKNNLDYRKIAWLPILLWISIPQCYWSYSNNMLENTMTIFVLLSVLLSYKCCKEEKVNYFFLILSGLCIFCASLTKGVPGLFPVVVPLIYWLTCKNISLKRVVIFALILILIPALIYGGLMLYQPARDSLSMYVFKRLLERVHDEPTVSGRFSIIGTLLINILPQIALISIVLIIGKFKKNIPIKPINKLAIFFIVLGLCGTLPLMTTLVQKGFYLVPAFPLFAIGLGILIAPVVSEFISQINIKSKGFKIGLTLSAVFLIGSTVFTITQIGRPGRNREMLHDVYLIGKTVPKYSIIAIPNDQDMWNDWELQCYLMRYFNISLDPNGLHPYYLDKVKHHGPTPANYSLNLHLLWYDIYSKDSTAGR
jgi:4-amino-4-deoxy-L-arabinose transferase-like glycosyltransferase